MNKMKAKIAITLTLSCLLSFHSAFAEKEGVFSSSEVSTVKDVDKIDYDKKYQFIFKKMFDVKGAKEELYSRKSNKGAALRYLKRYQGQGRFSDVAEREILVNGVISKRATKDAFSVIRKQIKENLADKGYKNYSKKPKHVKSITDYKRVTNSFFETNLRDALNEVSHHVEHQVIHQLSMSLHYLVTHLYLFFAWLRRVIDHQLIVSHL